MHVTPSLRLGFELRIKEELLKQTAETSLPTLSDAWSHAADGWVGGAGMGKVGEGVGG